MYCSSLLSTFNSVSTYLLFSLYASSIVAVGETMCMRSRRLRYTFNKSFCIKMPLPSCDALNTIERNGSLSALSYDGCLTHTV